MSTSLRDLGLAAAHPTYVIAEIGLNHGGDLDKARLLIDSAARAGVDAVKFQTYVSEKRAPAGMPAVLDLLRSLELPFSAFAKLKAHADAARVDFFSTAFDAESVECLEAIGCAMYKVASFDVVNKELLRAVAATGKPVLMSVGMAGLEEIREAYALLRRGAGRVALLHCVSAYPLAEENAELAAIHRLRQEFDCPVGYSDHTPGIRVPLYAVAAGARILEKHYKLDEAFDCIDAPVSITEAQMAELVAETRRLERILGQGRLGVREAEAGTVVFRRPRA